MCDMATVKEIIRVLEQYFPPYIAESWDNPGLQIGDEEAEVTKVVTALDICGEVVEQAIAEKAELILTHHPLLFRPIKSLRAGRLPDDWILRLIKAGISVYSAHTNLDSGEKGLNQYLSEQVGLQNIRALNQTFVEKTLKLEVMVPETHAQSLREALSAAGAGDVGKYADSFFMSSGESTFMPKEGTHPFCGEAGKQTRTKEEKLETVIWKKDVPEILQILEKVHPYEEPAFSLLPLENVYRSYSLGRIGELETPMLLKDWVQHLKQALGLTHILAVGGENTRISRAAVVSGAGIEFMRDAVSKGCQVLLTGDMKYHEAQAAQNLGLCVVDAGHQGTERIVSELLKGLLEQEKQNRGWKFDIIKAEAPELIWCE